MTYSTDISFTIWNRIVQYRKYAHRKVKLLLDRWLKVEIWSKIGRMGYTVIKLGRKDSGLATRGNWKSKTRTERAYCKKVWSVMCVIWYEEGWLGGVMQFFSICFRGGYQLFRKESCFSILFWERKRLLMWFWRGVQILTSSWKVI